MAYQNVAWMGGSYAPPTRMHVQVAVQMGEALLAKTDEGRRCAVCIVPVNKNYNKRSVKEACISDDVRRALIMAFVDAVKAEFAVKPRAGDCDFLYMDYELNAAGPVPTIDSLAMLKAAVPADNYYVAQGQDNILGIMKRTWVRSDELLGGYGFFMYPRGDIAGLEAQMMTAMMDPASSTKGIAPLGEEMARSVIDRVIYVGVGFNDDTSSSQVRRDLRAGNVEAVRAAMHPFVFNLMASMATTGANIWPYSSGECDEESAGGAAAAATYGGRRKERYRKERYRKRTHRKMQSRSRKSKAHSTKRRRYTRR